MAAERYFPTPSWVVDRLLDELPLPGGRWLEPAAGDGSIIQAVNRRRSDVRWTAIELDSARSRTVKQIPGVHGVRADGLTCELPTDIAVAISNPPFEQWQPMVDRLLGAAETVVMLLRLNVLGSAGRAPWWRKHPADVLVLPDRPSFSQDGQVDRDYYGWFVWRRGVMFNRLAVLRTTPRRDRYPATSQR